MAASRPLLHIKFNLYPIVALVCLLMDGVMPHCHVLMVAIDPSIRSVKIKMENMMSISYQIQVVCGKTFKQI